MSLLVLDGNSIANRAFYGVKLLSTRDGRYTNAIVGFFNILLSLIKECEPEEIAVCFDEPSPTFRHEMFEGYKATRHGMPQELAQQMPLIRQLLSDLGYRVLSLPGWEADDLLGTLSAAWEARGEACYLATGDRDSLQLVSPSTTVLLASPAAGATLKMDEAAIFEKYGVRPRQLIDVKALMGDSSDNIPGVKGIGEKTAFALIQRFGSLAGVYENLSDASIKPAARQKLEAEKEMAELSYTLGTIRRDAPVDTQAGAYRLSEGDPAAALSLMKSLELNKLIEKLKLKEKAMDSVLETADFKSSLLSVLTAMEPASFPSTIDMCPLPENPAGDWILAEKEGTWFGIKPTETLICTLSETQLLSLLDNPAVSLQVFDAAPLYALAMSQGGQGESIKWDGKLAAYLLDAGAKEYELISLIERYEAQPSFYCEAFPEAGSLAALFDQMKEALREEEQEALYNTIEFPLARVLADMSHQGILVDQTGIRAFGEEIAALARAAEERIYEAAGEIFNPNSPKQLGVILFEKMGLPHGKKTKTGWSTDAATLEWLRDKAPIVNDILEYRTYQKLLSTYVEGLLKAVGPDGRIHTHFKQTEARTGRLSSDEPNLQNIPIRTELGSRLRAFFLAAPGHVLVDADYSQIELRILAHVSGDKNMQAAFKAGEDIHRATAARIYNIPEILVTPAQRSGAKAVNFGIMYGKGAFSLAGDLDVAIPEAQAFLDSYLAAFPSVDRYMKKVIETAREKGYTTTLFGRRRALPELKSSNFQLRSAGERMARNTPIQGTAADVIKLAMVKVWQRLRNEKMDSRLILTVHDELIIEAPLAEAEAAARILREEMEGCVNYSVPLTTEVKTGENWLSAH